MFVLISDLRCIQAFLGHRCNAISGLTPDGDLVLCRSVSEGYVKENIFRPLNKPVTDQQELVSGTSERICGVFGVFYQNKSTRSVLKTKKIALVARPGTDDSLSD